MQGKANTSVELLQKKADKVKLFTVLVKQFPLAFKAVAKRSQIGHEKYADIDQDWQGFTVTPTEEYEDAIVRHMMLDGEPDETELDHATALAWNALALLELKLRSLKETKALPYYIKDDVNLQVRVVEDSSKKEHIVLDRDFLTPGCLLEFWNGAPVIILSKPVKLKESAWEYQINNPCTFAIGSTFIVKRMPK